MKNELSAILMVGILLLVFFLLAACAIIAFLYIYPSETEEGEVPPEGGGTNETLPQNGTIGLNTSASNISAEDMALWESINTPNAEAACLIRAREEAGASADLVYNCECSENASTLKKSYECIINTADPFTLYFANIECILEESACIVETNYGTTNVSFSELREYFGE